jgi:hypothetical protein
MKLLTLPCLLVLCMLEATGVSQDVKKDKLKYDMEYLNTAWGIRFKGATVQQGKDEGDDTLITMTLIFTKDIPDAGARATRGRNVAALRALFLGKVDNRRTQLRCYFFDEAGVAFTKQPPGRIQGEVTGKEGDSIRVTQRVPSDVWAKTKKISFREEPPQRGR